MKFDTRVSKLCTNTNQKLSAFSKMAKPLSFNKRKTLFRAFIRSQFKYCPVVWMTHGRRINNKTDRLYEKVLRTGVMTQFQHLINYLIWKNLPVFTFKISRLFMIILGRVWKNFFNLLGTNCFLQIPFCSTKYWRFFYFLTTKAVYVHP